MFQLLLPVIYLSFISLGLPDSLLGAAWPSMYQQLSVPFSFACAIQGLIFIGLGCAPVYPCLIHSTPAFFGRDYSQSVIGLQMASAYAGTCLMPPCFGILAEQFHVTLLPWYLFALLLLMMGSYGVLLKKCQKKVFTEGWNIVK